MKAVTQRGAHFGGQSQLVGSSASPNGRYLRYDDLRPVATGINHQLSNLRCLLAEAHATGRLAVLPPLRLEARHNFGVARDWSWDTYFDFDASRLVGADGREHRLPLVRELPVGKLNTHTLGLGARLSATETAEMVVRPVRNEVYAKGIPATEPAPVMLLGPSATVLDLAGPVIATLRGRNTADYAGVHIRRGDRLWGPMKWLMRPENIRRRLRKFGIREGANVFFLSDERDVGFWSALAPHYLGVRYTQFPELAELIDLSGGRAPDNYLLFEVEKEIMRHAATRVETFPLAGGDPSQRTLVPMATWIVAKNVRKMCRNAKRFVKRGRRKSAKLATRAIRCMGTARSLGR